MVRLDNLPPKLLVPLVDMMTNAGKDGVHKLAAVIDVRSREYFETCQPCSAISTTWGCAPASCSLTPATKCSSSGTSRCAGPIPAAWKPSDRRHP